MKNIATECTEITEGYIQGAFIIVSVMMYQQYALTSTRTFSPYPLCLCGV
jgi:hypothetical protein